MVRRSTDGRLILGGAGSRVEAVEDAVRADGPDESTRKDGRTAADRRAPEQTEPSGGVRGLHGDGPAQARQVDGRALDSEATVDDGAAGIFELRLLAADTAQARPVQQEDGARLGGGHDLTVGEQRHAGREIEIVGVVGRPRRRGEVLLERE